MKFSSALQNLTGFALRRYLIKYLLKQNGIRNVLFVFRTNLDRWKNEKVPINESNKKYQYILVKTRDELRKYAISTRFQGDSVGEFFAHDSIVACCVHNNGIVGYSWMHFDFDYTGETKSVLDGKFCLVGPSFVEKGYRGRRLVNSLKEILVDAAIKLDYKWMYSVVAFDNVKMVRNNHRIGFQLFRIIYSCHDERFVLGCDE